MFIRTLQVDYPGFFFFTSNDAQQFGLRLLGAQLSSSPSLSSSTEVKLWRNTNRILPPASKQSRSRRIGVWARLNAADTQRLQMAARCVVAGRMSCVGHRSGLLPVWVNRLCLGSPPPQGSLCKMALVGTCVSVCVTGLRSFTVCVCHRVVLQRKRSYTWSRHWTGLVLKHASAAGHFSLSLFPIGDGEPNKGRGAGNVTEHTPSLAARSCASLPARAC